MTYNAGASMQLRFAESALVTLFISAKVRNALVLYGIISPEGDF
jgi:hypothetical protein